ncbi:MAG TPA: HAD-IIIC family phosphatase [Anaerolineae bacterium]|nr:HAD-IIIC family phosphatase [Anaerolineae bacterium]
MLQTKQLAQESAEIKAIKCVVWDLDHTIWDGILLEGDDLRLRTGIADILRELDQRGILNSIASRNEHAPAMQKLAEFGLAHYFLYPQINWGAKSNSIEAIAQAINIGRNTLAFIDDQPFEREEVAFTYPDVLCIDAADTADLLNHPRLHPRFITPESRLRRQMYQSDINRNQIEAAFKGDNNAFLRSLNMRFVIKSAEPSDLQRAEELTQRTNQLNTTGYTYNYDELAALSQSDQHLLLVSSLTDRYGTYGTIGVALVEKGAEAWTIKLLLMSCRVMSRGVGTIVISHIMQQAKAAGAKLRAIYVPNGRNRQMYITYKFGGFREIAQDGNMITLEHDLTNIQPFPDYIDVQLPDEL